MSYQNILFGTINPINIHSRNDIIPAGIIEYIPKEFTSNQLIQYYKDILIGFHILVYNEKSIGIIFYLTKDPVISKDIQINLDKSIANIETRIDKKDKDLTIKWINVKSDNRGKGYAKYLLLLSLLYTSILDPTISMALLDDSSDGYANGIEDERMRKKMQSRNLYCTFGFKYEDPDGGPEMGGDISKMVIKNLPLFIQKRKIPRNNSPSKKRKAGSIKKKRKKKNTKKKKTKKKPKRKKTI